MELTTKTTILFPPDLYQHLVREAKRRGVSLGQLVRSACEAQYGRVSREDRVEAARQLAALALPVDGVKKMKKESVPEADSLLP
jgi:hypothetical protein